MNISPTNNSQPSFNGVKISADFATERPVIFHIVPDSVLTGIQRGKETVFSNAADTLTRLIQDPKSLYDHRQIIKGAQPRRAVASSRNFANRLSIKTYVNKVIRDLRLGHRERNDLFHYMKDIEPKITTVEGKPGEFQLIFSREAE